MYNAVIIIDNNVFVTSAPDEVKAGRVLLADRILEGGATLNARTGKLSRGQKLLKRVSIDTPSARFIDAAGVYPLFVVE